MSNKSERKKYQTARERIAEQQRLAKQAERRRRTLAIGAIAVILVAVVAIVVVSLVNKKTPTAQSGSTSGPLPASVLSKLTVPASTLSSVGGGNAFTSAIKPVTGPALTSNGKPEMLYIGAEWCPYCAAERWAMAVALSRFGTFSPLHGVHSSSTDVYPNTATLTFYKATYTSKYLTFTPVENENVNHATLQAVTPAQQALWTKYAPPGNGYPFIDIGNRFISGATYDPQVLHGLTWQQIANDLHNPSSQVAKGAIGSANLFTAAICKITGNQPASVCTAAPVTSVEGSI